jgi:apolipoprotein N-acyltransferase
LFERLNEVPRDMIPGKDEGPLNVEGIVVADAICFDIAYDDVLHNQVRRGAEIAVVQTSNATFFGTDQPSQQFEITRARAVEVGRSIVVASTNGKTGIITSRGKVLQEAPVGVSTTVVDKVPLYSGLTPAVRHQRLLRIAIVAGAAVGIVLAGGRLAPPLRRRRRNEARRPTY